MTRFIYREDSGHTEPLQATTLEAATAEAESLLQDGDWPPGWVTAGVIDTTDDSIAATAEAFIEPPEPPCTESAHDWRGDPRIGLRENPGCMGIGGAAIQQTDVCLHCGTVRVTVAGDTNPIGAGNRDSMRYDHDLYDEEWEGIRELYGYAGGES